MVLSFHGKEVSELELAEACETGWLGNTCGELVLGVEKYRFEAEEIENITPEYALTILKMQCPFIALLGAAVLYGGIEGFGHFVVVTGFEDNKICYHDPDRDRDLTRNATEFFKAWKPFSFKGVRIWKSTKR